MTRRLFITMHLYALACICLIACSGPRTAEPAEPVDDEKPAIESAVRAHWATNRPGETINGLAFHKFSADLYLVGASFDDGENAVNVVARRFENEGKAVWKVEPYNRKWRELLRVQE